jgi:DNA-binding transcriptional regulator YiaG
MNAEQICLIKDSLRLSNQDLAKALGVAPITVARWETGTTTPTGLQAEVLQGLHSVALEVQRHQNQQQAELIRGLVLLGIGALVFYLLNRAARET